MSLPTRDHVPELMISAAFASLTGAAAKALAVSCDPMAISLARLSPTAAASGSRSSPTTVPGATISGFHLPTESQGPLELEEARMSGFPITLAETRCLFSTEPTETQFLAVPGEFMVPGVGPLLPAAMQTVISLLFHIKSSTSID
jgi:hypothetical protein